MPVRTAGTLFKLEKVSRRLQGCFPSLKSILTKCRDVFQPRKVPLQIAWSFLDAKQPRANRRGCFRFRIGSFPLTMQLPALHFVFDVVFLRTLPRGMQNNLSYTHLTSEDILCCHAFYEVKLNVSVLNCRVKQDFSN